MIRPELPPMPARIAALPLSDRGYPVPFFVAWPNGKPDFRLSDGQKIKDCVNRSLCFVCGQPLGRFKTFPIGPMCSINRVSAEPPSHIECCQWSVRACPFLLRPNMTRRKDEVTVASTAPGIMIERNPGVIALWTVTHYQMSREHNGVLFRFGDPESVSWWSEGRPATRDEVQESIRTGLPQLVAVCADDEERQDLARQTKAAEAYLPVLDLR